MDGAPHLLVEGAGLLLVGGLDHAQPVAQLVIRFAWWTGHHARDKASALELV